MTMVRTRTDELRDEIGVSCMYLHAVKTALTRPVHRLAEFLNAVLDLRHFETAMDRRTIEIEPRICTHRYTMTSIDMRHITAVSQLDTGFRTLRMNSVGHLFHIGNDLRTDIELTVKRHTAQVHSAIGNSRHSYSATRYGDVIVLQFLGRCIMSRHVLKGCRTDDSIPQCNGPQLKRGKKFGFFHF